MNGLDLLVSRWGTVGGADSTASIAFSGIGISIIFLACLLSIIGIAERVLLGLAAYNDARAKSNTDAVMWGLLVGFLGLIPGIIYLCIRNSARRYTVCQNCSFAHDATDPNCPKCGAPNPVSEQYMNPFAAQQAHRAKVQFTVALVLIGVGVLAAIVIGISFAAAVFSVTGNSIYY